MTVFCRGAVLADKIKKAGSFLERFKGLMGTTALDKGEGLILNSSSIHCFFMRIPIDAVYISKNMIVLGKETLNPWKVGKWFRGTRYILELGVGAAASVCIGDPISLEY